MSNLAKLVVSAVTASFLLTGCNHLMTHSSQITPGDGTNRKTIFSTMDVSPDGTMIAFSGVGAGGSRLFLLHLASNTVTQLTNTPGDDNYPAFSPDGKTLVYQSAMAVNQSRHLFLISVDGTHRRQLTNAPATSDENPHFSPNGEVIVFSRAEQFHAQDAFQSTSSGFDVWVVNQSGSGLRRVTHLNSDGVMRPKFYPDGRHVLFEKTTTLETSGAVMSLARADTTGQQPIQDVLKFSGADFSPCFYPDGKRILFGGNFNGVLDLYRVTLPSGKPLRILAERNNTGFCNPIVTSDGKSIYCLERYTPDLYKMNSDGTGLHKIADSSLFSDPMHWKASTSGN